MNKLIVFLFTLSLLVYGAIIYILLDSPAPSEPAQPFMYENNQNQALRMVCTRLGREFNRCRNYEMMCYTHISGMAQCFPLNLPQIVAKKKRKKNDKI